MTECRPVPCPSFEETTLHVEGVCDCRDFNTPGNPYCPVHGDLIRAWLDGYQAALDVLKHVHAELYKGLGYYGQSRDSL